MLGDLWMSVLAWPVCAFLLGLVIGIIPAVVGARKKQVRLGIGGFFACGLSGMLFGLLPTIPVCVVFVWLLTKLGTGRVTEEEKTKLRTKAVQVVSIVILVSDIIGVLALGYIPTFVGPTFREIYADFGELEELPAMTQVIVLGPAPLFLVCLAVLIASLIVKEVIIVEKNVTLIINVVVGIVVYCSVLMCGVALYLPILDLAETVF